MPMWRLPDHFSDVLPTEARQLEALRYCALDTFRTWGYELVAPPLLEHLTSLTTGTAQDLDDVMFKVVDPASGKLLGIRADVTPQAARIDAHLLNRKGLTRLCYCLPSVRSQVSDAFTQRELLQLGAELFGHAGIEADVEIQDLALHIIKQLGIEKATLALSHSGVLTALFDVFPALLHVQTAVLDALRTKNRNQIIDLCDRHAPSAKAPLIGVINTYGSPKDLDLSQFKSYPQIIESVNALLNLAQRAQLQGIDVVIDLADLSGYGYHTGVQFVVFVEGLSSSLLRGGRYDAIGQAFGRSRPATGFSLDLRALSHILPTRVAMPAIAAPWDLDNNTLMQAVSALRQQGHVVICQLPGHLHEQDEFLFDRRLVETPTGWVVQAI